MELDLTTLLANGVNWTAILYATVLVIVVNTVKIIVEQIIKNSVGKNTFKKTMETVTTINSLAKTHPIFNDLSCFRDIKVPNCSIGGPVRTKVFRDCLKIYFDVTEKIFRELLSQEITNSNFLVLNVQACNNKVIKVREELIAHEIPMKVIEKFEQWTLKSHDHTLAVLSDLDSSKIADTVVEKQYMALCLYRENAYFTMIDAEKTLKGLNGELSGTNYKGEAIEPLH